MSTKQSLEARVQSLTDELRSRRSTSEKQAEQVIRRDRRSTEGDDADSEFEVDDAGIWGVDDNHLRHSSTSERQASRVTRGRSRTEEGD